MDEKLSVNIVFLVVVVHFSSKANTVYRLEQQTIPQKFVFQKS